MRAPISELNNQSFDVAIIGGGINGAAAAQHLAAAGYSVVLVEKNDYASAASSRSSRVLHSGLSCFAPVKSLWEHVLRPGRFLDKIRSAIESMSAMGDIVHSMPERVKPMNLLMPIYNDMPYSGLHVDIGVWFLGLFERNGVSLAYKRYQPREHDTPSISKRFRDQDKVTAFALFRDFQFVWPERICLDAIMNAKYLGALTRNYTTLKSCKRTADNLWTITVNDTVEPGESAIFSAHLVVNTAGVWMDDIIKASTRKAVPKRRVIAVKGVHVLVQLPEEFRGLGVSALNTENEAIFLLPWGDRHYIGPTETVYKGSLDDVRPDEEDIAFLIKEANYLMPSLQLTRADVMMAWAGVRPITYDERFPKGRRLPFSVLHDLSEDGLPNMIALTWGTINLHRNSAKNLLKAVRKRVQPSQNPVKTKYSAHDIPEPPNSVPAFSEEPSVTLADLAKLAEEEDVVTLVDVLYRRTHLGWRPHMNLDEITKAAAAVGGGLGWSKEKVGEEVQMFISYARKMHLVSVK